MSTLTIKFSKDGKVDMQVSDFVGPSCTEVSAPYKGAMSGVVVSDTPTPEFYEEQPQEQHQQNYDN